MGSSSELEARSRSLWREPRRSRPRERASASSPCLAGRSSRPRATLTRSPSCHPPRPPALALRPEARSAGRSLWEREESLSEWTPSEPAPQDRSCTRSSVSPLTPSPPPARRSCKWVGKKTNLLVNTQKSFCFKKKKKKKKKKYSALIPLF